VRAEKHYDGQKADVFSLGVILYTMLTAEFPFK
jgi:serine/threonine protein kinase